MEFSAVIVAAGSGQRAGGGTAKQWRALGGKAVLRWSVEAMAAAGARQIVCVIRPGDEDAAKAALAGLSGWELTTGGDTRTQSVARGLQALTPTEAVMIHDAARPFIPKGLAVRLLAALARADGAIPALPVADTLKQVTDTGLTTTPREGLWRAQTPQAFRFAAITAAYAAETVEATDDAALIEAAGGTVAITPGDPILMKLTYPEDFAMADAIAADRRVSRTGSGFDAHKFGPGDAVWLCGVKIPHSQGLIGHSDADVGLHALTDALLGAIGAGDIGEHFPPSDPQWKGASSDRFARHAADLIAGAGGRIVNVDITLICERPRIAAHRAAMVARVAEILGLQPAQVSIKATTTEGMGFTGRGEGLAAQALATVEVSGGSAW